VPPNKFFGSCDRELPCKWGKIHITLAPITLKIIISFSPHSSKHKCLCLATLSIEQSSNGCYKSITCTITWTLRPRWWILIRFSCLDFIVTKVKINFRNTSTSELTLAFVFKFPTLHNHIKKHIENI